jgi:hypothetical protein
MQPQQVAAPTRGHTVILELPIERSVPLVVPATGQSLLLHLFHHLVSHEPLEQWELASIQGVLRKVLDFSLK